MHPAIEWVGARNSWSQPAVRISLRAVGDDEFTLSCVQAKACYPCLTEWLTHALRWTVKFYLRVSELT